MPRLRQIGIDVDVHRVIEQSRRSFSESENDILRRMLLGEEQAKAEAGHAPHMEGAPDPGPSRIRGRWTVEACGQRIAAANLKDAYRTLLLALDAQFPDFLPAFAQEKARSRRFVARSPVQLYLASPALATNHAKPLTDGWFFDTNLSTEQVSKRARIAARLCGLGYGRDVRILNNLEEI